MWIITYSNYCCVFLHPPCWRRFWLEVTKRSWQTFNGNSRGLLTRSPVTQKWSHVLHVWTGQVQSSGESSELTPGDHEVAGRSRWWLSKAADICRTQTWDQSLLHILDIVSLSCFAGVNICTQLCSECHSDRLNLNYTHWIKSVLISEERPREVINSNNVSSEVINVIDQI